MKDWYEFNKRVKYLIENPVRNCFYLVYRWSFRIVICFIVDILSMLKIKNMYSLDCSYYDKSFDTIQELVDSVISSGMDPSYEITKNGVGIGEELTDFIIH